MTNLHIPLFADANDISLEVSPNKTLFIFENLEDSKIITCTTKNKLEKKYRFFQPQWEESMIDFVKSKASIREANLKISSKLLDGQFCYRCVIPKLQEASPFKRHCFTVVFKKRLQVALVPSREGNIYPIENTTNVSCIVRYDNTSADRIPPKLKCALKDKGEVFSKIQGYTVNGSILVNSNAERVKAEIDAEIMEDGGASSGLSTRKVKIWFAREEDLEIDFPGAHGAYAKASTFTQLCTFKWAELGEAFKQNFTWKAFGKNQTVNNQRAPILLVRNETELNKSYFCQFSGLNKSKALKYKIIDLDKLKFSTKAKHIYRTGDKNHTITCEVEPPEAELLPNFSYGWQVRHVSKTLDVQDYNDGAHHMVCSSPASKVAKLKWAFYVVSKLKG
ncbi:unnamed protein product [Dibothriocephalus latus]|uniref:Uncharacterized protein n=1 Tax=Dibothriocephalus latus TaxID=60516 RepID=A0A3P7NKQ2_DIBLA|nr:unnamed protein product [Dibothriocephalus latus]